MVSLDWRFADGLVAKLNSMVDAEDNLGSRLPTYQDQLLSRKVS